jgi:Two component regulator propeller
MRNLKYVIPVLVVLLVVIGGWLFWEEQSHNLQNSTDNNGLPSQSQRAAALAQIPQQGTNLYSLPNNQVQNLTNTPQINSKVISSMVAHVQPAVILGSNSLNPAELPGTVQLHAPLVLTTISSPEKLIGCPAKYITCIAWDSFRDSFWVGTDGSGVYQGQLLSDSKVKWVHFTAQDGFADESCYAIAVDKAGRVWAGTDRHGVEVYISPEKSWRRYDVLPLDGSGEYGPLGSHPFCISIDPKEGNVYIGTEAGISIYDVQKNVWNYLTVADGLPSDQINAIGFLPSGAAVIGTQCQGITIAWQEQTGHWAFHVITGPLQTLMTASGDGLPSCLINSILVADANTVYVGTDSGMAISNDDANSWQFEQGKDFIDHVEGLFPKPQNFIPPPSQTINSLLSESHITCLAKDAAGNLWIGFWRAGFMVISGDGQKVYRSVDDLRYQSADPYIQNILPLTSGMIALARYGGGLTILDPSSLAPWLNNNKIVKSLINRTSPERFSVANLQYPLPAAVPSENQIAALRNQLMKIPDNPTITSGAYINYLPVSDQLIKVPTNPAADPLVIALDDDWCTQGDWIDHYGRELAYLFAGGGAFDHIYGHASILFTKAQSPWINSYWSSSDAVRHWFTDTSFGNSDDPRVLQDVLNGGRTLASDDDHGEVYKTTIDGPNLYWSIGMPVGDYIDLPPFLVPPSMRVPVPS